MQNFKFYPRPTESEATFYEIPPLHVSTLKFENTYVFDNVTACSWKPWLCTLRALSETTVGEAQQ